jgi:putative membrane protein
VLGLCDISQTRKSPIKAIFIIISQLAIITVSADSPIKRFGAPNVVTNGVSVTISQTDTGIGSSLHLRAQSAPTQPSGNVALSEKDKSFIQKAAGDGQQEVENGKMAEKQGQSGDVKRIGARIVADHTRANKELTQVASQKGLSFDTRGVKAQNLGNAGFDRQYLKLLEVDYKNDIAEFQKEAKSGDDRDVKSWVSETLPMLKEHLAMVQDAEKKIK